MLDKDCEECIALLHERDSLAVKLAIANTELAFQNTGKDKRADRY
jgi:hypothetical protein